MPVSKAIQFSAIFAFFSPATSSATWTRNYGTKKDADQYKIEQNG